MTQTTLLGFGLGVGVQSKAGAWLDIYYPQPQLNPAAAVTGIIANTLGYQGGNAAIKFDNQQAQALAEAFTEAGLVEEAELCGRLSGSKQPLVATMLASDSAPASVPEAHLKLQFLSHRLVQPHQLDLNGLFGALPNVAWTSAGAIALDELPDRQLEARLNGEVLEVMSVDKFPKMTNYVVPAGVRIADTDRVRLGAYLGDGTTIMHEGFVNFNAGTLGTSMVEGRISAGVVVGKGSDLGGGCSTMGTLSGGGNIVISIGEGCLIGANAGTGIPLGDRCTIESGLYLTSGMKVIVKDETGTEVETVKARELAGKSDLLFIRNSNTGSIECRTNKSAIELNQELHSHN